MSWTLLFYRRSGEPELIIEEVDPLFERLPRFTRVPTREEDPLAENEVRFHFHNPITGTEFDFSFQTLEEAEDEPDAEFTETTLLLELPTPGTPEVPQEAIPIAMEVCQHLHLLVRDPQAEQETPAPPRADALIRSYNTFGKEVGETMQYLAQRRTGYARLAVGIAFLLAGATLLLVALSLIRPGR